MTDWALRFDPLIWRCNGAYPSGLWCDRLCRTLPQKCDKPMTQPQPTDDPAFTISQASRERLALLMDQLEQECVWILRHEIEESRRRRGES